MQNPVQVCPREAGSVSAPSGGLAAPGRPPLEAGQAADGQLADAGGAVAEPLRHLGRAEAEAEAKVEDGPVAVVETTDETAQVVEHLHPFLLRRLGWGDLGKLGKIEGLDTPGAPGAAK